MEKSIPLAGYRYPQSIKVTEGSRRTGNISVAGDKKSIEIPLVVTSEQGQAQTMIYHGVVGLQYLIFYT